MNASNTPPLDCLGRLTQLSVIRALALPLPGRRAAKEDQLGQSIVACETQIHLFDSNSDCYRQKLPYTEAWLLVATKIMFGITDLATFFIGTVIIVLLPGPNSMFVMTVAARDGLRAGFSGALGIFAGDSILMMLSVAGVASLIQTTPILLMTLKLFGGGYLAWLGFGFSNMRSINRLRSLNSRALIISTTSALNPFEQHSRFADSTQRPSFFQLVLHSIRRPK